MHWIFKVICFLFFLLNAFLVQSQEEDAIYRDVIHLTKGKVFKGKILEHQVGQYIRLEIDEGEILEITEKEVKKIVRQRLYTNKDFKIKGIYYAAHIASLNGKGLGDAILGLGLHAVVGYQFNQWLALGLGAGAESYSLEDGRMIFPVYGEIRGYFNRKRIAPYYSFHAGYGFATRDRDLGIVSARGGLMVHPAIGLKFGSHARTEILVDAGYKFQEAHYTRELNFIEQTEIQDILFKRLTIRVGLVF